MFKSVTWKIRQPLITNYTVTNFAYLTIILISSLTKVISYSIWDFSLFPKEGPLKHHWATDAVFKPTFLTMLLVIQYPPLPQPIYFVQIVLYSTLNKSFQGPLDTNPTNIFWRHFILASLTSSLTALSFVPGPPTVLSCVPFPGSHTLLDVC